MNIALPKLIQSFGLALVVLSLPALIAHGQSAGGSFKTTSSVIAGGGGSSTGSGNLTVEGTVGQPAAGTPLSNGPFSQVGGFWPTTLAVATPTPTPGPNTVQFAGSNISVNEGEFRARLTVTRTGDTSGSATVDFASNDSFLFVDCLSVSGTASQRCDYITSAGTLSFAAGETSKTLTLLIIDDAYADGAENISISLSNPIGAGLGTPSTAVLTITDNDSGVPATNPNDDPLFFVREQYYDFLNRAPDPGGFAYWTGQITACGSDMSCVRTRRVDVSNAFFYEQEFQETGAYVYRIYKVSFAVRPTYAQFMPDRSRVIGGTHLDQSKMDFANAFVQRTAFVAQYPGSMTPAQYVDALNANTGNALTQTQLDALVNGLVSGAETRGSVLRRIADNSVFIDREYNTSFVLTQYFGYLRRNPDQAGFNFWLGQVNSFPIRDVGIQHAMVCSFITSDEYQRRFSSVVAHTNAECPH